MNKHTVLLPNGKVGKRNSENRTYTHAVIGVVTEQSRADRIARLENELADRTAKGMDCNWTNSKLSDARLSKAGYCRVVGWSGSLALAHAAARKAVRDYGDGYEYSAKECEMTPSTPRDNSERSPS